MANHAGRSSNYVVDRQYAIPGGTPACARRTACALREQSMEIEYAQRRSILPTPQSCKLAALRSSRGCNGTWPAGRPFYRQCSSVIPAATIGFQSPLLKPLWDGLVAGMQLVGVLVGTIGFVLGLLIGAAGLLWSRSVQLGTAGATAGGGAGTSHTAAGASDRNDACPTAKRQPGGRRRRFGR